MPKPFAGIYTIVKYDGESKNKMVMCKTYWSLGRLWEECSRKVFLPSSPQTRLGGDFHLLESRFPRMLSSVNWLPLGYREECFRGYTMFSAGWYDDLASGKFFFSFPL